MEMDQKAITVYQNGRILTFLPIPPLASTFVMCTMIQYLNSYVFELHLLEMLFSFYWTVA